MYFHKIWIMSSLILCEMSPLLAMSPEVRIKVGQKAVNFDVNFDAGESCSH